MATKNDPGKFDCYGAARWDEPLFVLLARDISAPLVVMFWGLCRAVLILIRVKPSTDWPMVREAFACARSMWRYERPSRWRDAGRSSDTTVKIDVAGTTIEVFVEYTFSAGGSDFFAGGCWQPGDGDDIQFLDIWVVNPVDGKHVLAPPWLTEIVSNSAPVYQQICDAEFDSAASDDEERYRP
jgi:hypothetical protein